MEVSGDIEGADTGLSRDSLPVLVSARRIKATSSKRSHPSFFLSLVFLSSTHRALSACRAIWAQFNPPFDVTWPYDSDDVSDCLLDGIDKDKESSLSDLDQYLSTLLCRSLFLSLAAALPGGLLAYFGFATHSCKGNCGRAGRRAECGTSRGSKGD